MSMETPEWGRNNWLVGNTRVRGDAWWKNWFGGTDDNGEPNHYDGFIPVEDAERRIFNWEAIETPIYVPALPFNPENRSPDGGNYVGDLVEVTDRKAIRRSDSGLTLGIFKPGYEMHQYREWLISRIAHLFDSDTLGLASVGLLRGGARAFATIELPDHIETPSGFTFRPNLTAGTSFDGSLASIVKLTFGVAVCDNTFAAALAENTPEFRVKHSRYSNRKINDVRAALDIVMASADDFTTQIEEWSNTSVTDAEFDAFLNALTPVPEDEGKGRTRAENRQSDIRVLWQSDPRCNPWHGTKLGVIQTLNTWQQQETTVRGDKARTERNIENVLSDKVTEFDNSVIATLDTVLAA